MLGRLLKRKGKPWHTSRTSFRSFLLAVVSITEIFDIKYLLKNYSNRLQSITCSVFAHANRHFLLYNSTTAACLNIIFFHIISTTHAYTILKKITLLRSTRGAQCGDERGKKSKIWLHRRNIAHLSPAFFFWCKAYRIECISQISVIIGVRGNMLNGLAWQDATIINQHIKFIDSHRRVRLIVGHFFTWSRSWSMSMIIDQRMYVYFYHTLQRLWSYIEPHVNPGLLM